jgi:hypothetical protein
MAKLRKFVYDANGVPFNIYETIKSNKFGPTRYWLLEDYSTGKRRLLNDKTEMAARERADEIRAAMVKGQASRMSLRPRAVPQEVGQAGPMHQLWQVISPESTSLSRRWLHGLFSSPKTR